MDVRLRPLEAGDAALLARFYASQRAFLAPFDPPRPDSFYTLEGQRLELGLLERERARDRLYRFLIEADGEPAGAISVSRITRGPFQNGGLGYWVARELNGRGVATGAIGRVCEWGFGPAGLHRLEAATLVSNVGSQVALRRNGFLEIGRSPNYLYIDGAWRDHLLFARTVDDRKSGSDPERFALHPCDSSVTDPPNGVRPLPAGARAGCPGPGGRSDRRHGRAR